MANFCTSCGGPLREGAVFCPHCGAPVSGVNMAGMAQSAAGMVQNTAKSKMAQLKDHLANQLKDNATVTAQPTMTLFGKQVNIGNGISFNPFKKKGE